MHTFSSTIRHKTILLTTGLLAAGAALAGCGSDNGQTAAASDGEVTVENCGEDITFPTPAQKIFVNERAAVSHLFELGVDDQITAAAGLSSGSQEELKEIYGTERIEALPINSDEYMNLENILTARPDTVIAGYSWGYSVEDNLTPSRLLADYDIPGYTISVSCQQESGKAQGIMPPWEAMFTDLRNLGKIVGHEDRAKSKLEDIKKRIDALTSAPQNDRAPTVFSSSLIVDDGILSGGALSADHAIIEAAGGQNVFADIDEARPTVSWETVTAAKPDVIMIVASEGNDHYGYASAIESFKTNPATKDLPAVKEERFVRIPMVMTRGTPLMIDAAENMRKALEKWDLVPESDIAPELELTQP